MSTTPAAALIALEKKFWQSLVDADADTALSLLAEPALMVSAQGALQFNHAQYRQMAEQGEMVVKDFELDDVDVLFANDDTAVVTYRVTQTVGLRDGADEIEQQMADASVWTRTNGGWRCVLHTETELDADDEDDDEEA